jgi:CRP-like cAMP-binding protein
MKKPLAILKRLILFQELKQEDLKKVALRVIEGTYKAGEYLFRAGTLRSELFIIQTGEV